MARLFQISVSKVLKIQRLYRAHRIRLMIPALVAEKKREEVMNKYLKQAEEVLRKKKKKVCVI